MSGAGSRSGPCVPQVNRPFGYARPNGLDLRLLPARTRPRRVPHCCEQFTRLTRGRDVRSPESNATPPPAHHHRRGRGTRGGCRPHSCFQHRLVIRRWASRCAQVESRHDGLGRAARPARSAQSPRDRVGPPPLATGPSDQQGGGRLSAGPERRGHGRRIDGRAGVDRQRRACGGTRRRVLACGIVVLGDPRRRRCGARGSRPGLRRRGSDDDRHRAVASPGRDWPVAGARRGAVAATAVGRCGGHDRAARPTSSAATTGHGRGSAGACRRRTAAPSTTSGRCRCPCATRPSPRSGRHDLRVRRPAGRRGGRARSTPSSASTRRPGRSRSSAICRSRSSARPPSRLGGVIYVAGGSTGPADCGGHLRLRPASRAGCWSRGTSSRRCRMRRWRPSRARRGSSAARAGAPRPPPSRCCSPNIKFGTAGAPGAGSPYFGEKLLIADRGNNRMLVLDDTGAVIWTYPNPPSMPPPPGPGGLLLPRRRLLHRSRHGDHLEPGGERDHRARSATRAASCCGATAIRRSRARLRATSTSPTTPTCLKNGNVTVADADNCRILFISPSGSVVQPDRDDGVVRAQSADGRRRPQRRHPARGRERPRLRDEGLVHLRVHAERHAWCGRCTSPSGTPPTPSRSAPTSTCAPTTRTPAASSSSTGPARSSTRTGPPRASTGSTSRRWRSCCRAASSWSTTTTATAWRRSTRRPRRWSGTTGCPTSPARRPG